MVKTITIFYSSEKDIESNLAEALLMKVKRPFSPDVLLHGSSAGLYLVFLSSLSLSLGSLDSPLLLNCLKDYEMHCCEWRTDLRYIVSLTSCLRCLNQSLGEVR